MGSPRVTPALSLGLRRMAEQAWAKAVAGSNSKGDRAFLVVASSYWNTPRISQHDIARTLSARGPTVFLEPTWMGHRPRWSTSFDDGGPIVVGGPAIPRGLRIGVLSRLNLLLGLATWRALLDAAPRGRRLVTWVVEYRLAWALEREGFRPPFVFHNVDVRRRERTRAGWPAWRRSAHAHRRRRPISFAVRIPRP